VSITDRVLDALKTAIQLEERVTSMARNVSELARDVRDIDKRLVRVETVIEFGTRGGVIGTRPAIEDRGK
jgi:hypothetical protein